VTVRVGALRRGDRGEIVIPLEGELDDVRPPELFAAVERARTDAGTVVLDCAGLRSVNLEGVAALITLWDRARGHGTRVLVRAADAQVVDKLRQVGVLAVLTGAPAPARPDEPTRPSA
jgi:anti-anti-sigma regulatory factor